MDKANALEEIAQEIKKCSICPVGKTGIPVVGEGNPNAKVVFIGEAPGKQEAKTGRPFIGRSGTLLRSLIRSVGLQEEDVYITSPVKYLPLRGTPTIQDIDHGRTHLEKQLQIIDPSLVVLLGAVAAYGVLEKKVLVKKDHGTIIKKDGKSCLITVHPAAALRFPSFKALLVEDFNKITPFIA